MFNSSDFEITTKKSRLFYSERDFLFIEVRYYPGSYLYGSGKKGYYLHCTPAKMAEDGRSYIYSPFDGRCVLLFEVLRNSKKKAVQAIEEANREILNLIDLVCAKNLIMLPEDCKISVWR